MQQIYLTINPVNKLLKQRRRLETTGRKLKDRQEAITFLVTENIELKKNINGED